MEYGFFVFIVIVKPLNHVQLFATPWTAACQASPSFTISWSLLKLMSIELMVLSNHLILCHPLLLLPSIFPSTRVFSNELALWIRWPKNWSFSISASNQYSRFISFKIDWFDLLAVQGILKSLLQCHSLKASIICWKVQKNVQGILPGTHHLNSLNVKILHYQNQDIDIDIVSIHTTCSDFTGYSSTHVCTCMYVYLRKFITFVSLCNYYHN